MPPKKKMAAPIDRPLSRAYLRKFTGWSTAYPPGASDPASQRKSENLLVNRDGSIRQRPGLNIVLQGLAVDQTMIGTYEPFYLNSGAKAYLFAVKDVSDNKVIFKVARPQTGDPQVWDILELSHADVGFTVTGWVEGYPWFTVGTTYVKYVQIDNKILALSDNGEAFITFYVGATKKIPKIQSLTQPDFADRTSVWTSTNDWIDGPQTTFPPVAANYGISGALASSVVGEAIYNYGFFYTYSSELGESAPSTVAATRLTRPFGGWKWTDVFSGGAAGDTASPGSSPEEDAERTPDQLFVRPTPDGSLDAMIALGATRFNVYLLAWSDQDSVPVEGQQIISKEISPATDTANFYARITPASQFLGQSLPIPTLENRYNSSGPSGAGQGLVAADRLVLVNDPTAAAVIRWTTNEQGNYLNFAPQRGGGYKTLTSGNMQVPACVKLWQNPQSADTITVLCMGTDGHSTSYYMQPASVSSQSDNTIVMGFEETTATPGTTSPYGCEVANNTLYHPLDDQLMKTTASNYNINHKSMTDMISNQWRKLINKDKIVSCFFDQRLYFLVHNPDGAALEAGCNGNEVWVLDLASEGGSWCRWLTQGVSLKKAEAGDQVYLSLVQPKGISIFDEALGTDDQYAGADLPIPWLLETNTQGANRAHDAWSLLQQANLVVGNFTGTMRYGIRGIDLHGRKIDKSKKLRSIPSSDDQGLPWDVEDYLLIQESMKEWYFYASSETVADVVQPFFGQLTLVQYRYAPISVNVGFEFGSVETFEYQREGLNFSGRTTDNGVPQPYIDPARP